MTSDRQLKHWFDKYNREWFNGEVPETIIYWEPPADAHAESCPVFEVADGKFEIKMDPANRGIPFYWKILLLHEMVHIKLWARYPKHQHGRVFQEEMLNLAQAGAFKKLW